MSQLPLPEHRVAATGARRWLPPVAAALGLVLLIRLLSEIGLATVLVHMRQLGTVLPLVLLLAGSKYVLQTVGWRLALEPGERPPWGPSLAATLSGDALGYLTWAGALTGEPVRAYLMRGDVPTARGMAAGAIERTLYNATAAVLIAVVLSVLTVPSPWPFVVAGTVTATVPLFGLAGRRGILHSVSRQVRSANGKALQAFRRVIALNWRERRASLATITALCLVQHGLLVTEAWLMLRAIGADATFATAVTFEAVTKLVNTAGAFVPGRLGIAEGGSAALAAALGFAASQGLSLALMRRARALICTAVGLALAYPLEVRTRRLLQSSEPSSPQPG